MPAITFRAKAETVWNHDDTPAYRCVKVPAIQRRHCDMNAFRRHPKFGGLANSALFDSLLRRELKAAGVGEWLRLDQLPACATVDEGGFLAVVTIRVGEG